MKKILIIALALLSIMTVLSSCGEKKILHCDKCGKEIEVDADSNMDEDWILFCDECGDIELEEETAVG